MGKHVRNNRIKGIFYNVLVLTLIGIGLLFIVEGDEDEEFSPSFLMKRVNVISDKSDEIRVIEERKEIERAKIEEEERLKKAKIEQLSHEKEKKYSEGELRVLS